MSTKIHNGLILRGAHLEDALRVLARYRDEAVGMAQMAAGRRVARMVSLHRDVAANFCELPRRRASYDILDAHEAYRDARVQVLGRRERNVDWDFSLDVALMPHNGDVLAIFYAERSRDYGALLHAAGFADYSYQNSTDDLPEGVSESAYKARGERWDEVLPRRATPASAGLLYQMVTWDDFHPAMLSREQIEAGLPSEDDRRRRASMALTEEGPGFNWSGMGIMAMVRRLEAEEPNRRSGVLLAEQPLF